MKKSDDREISTSKQIEIRDKKSLEMKSWKQTAEKQVHSFRKLQEIRGWFLLSPQLLCVSSLLFFCSFSFFFASVLCLRFLVSSLSQRMSSEAFIDGIPPSPCCCLCAPIFFVCLRFRLFVFCFIFVFFFIPSFAIALFFLCLTSVSSSSVSSPPSASSAIASSSSASLPPSLLLNVHRHPCVYLRILLHLSLLLLFLYIIFDCVFGSLSLSCVPDSPSSPHPSPSKKTDCSYYIPLQRSLPKLASAPRRINSPTPSPVHVAAAAAAANKVVLPSGWNKAGTFEERNMRSASLRCFVQLLT